MGTSSRRSHPAWRATKNSATARKSGDQKQVLTVGGPSHALTSLLMNISRPANLQLLLMSFDTEDSRTR